jgi:hypothetical protein
MSSCDVGDGNMGKRRQMEIPLQQNFTDTLPLDSMPKGPNTSVFRTHEQKGPPWPLRQYLREMFEVTLGLGITVLATLFIPRNWAASELIFCAFFLIVFAIAIRYRAATAYSASVLAAASYSLLLWQHPALYAPFDIRYVFFEAFLLLSSGVCIHTMLRAQRQRFIAAEQQQVQRDAILQENSHKYQTALMINEELEGQIAGQTTTVITISDKLAQLWKLKGDARYTAILDMVMHVLEAQSCVLYVQGKGEMHFYACQPEGAYYAPTLNLDDPLISSVLRLRRVRTVRDVLAQEKAVSRTVAVMAGPLVDQYGQVVGMVIIDTLPLLKFTPGAVHLFSSLLQLASLALQTAWPEGETDQYAYQSSLSLSPAERSTSTGPHTPLPEVDIGEDKNRSVLSLYPTEHTTAVRHTLMGGANHAK